MTLNPAHPNPVRGIERHNRREGNNTQNTMNPQDETPSDMLAMLCAWILGTIALYSIAVMLWH